MSADLERLAQLVERESGIRLKPNQFPSLQAALQRALPGVGPAALVARAGDPASGPELVQQLLDEVTVKETTFMRDRRQLAAIPWPDLLERARARGSDVVRVWSAGCATGEEPYTLALLACEQLGLAAPPVRILATDLSRDALAAARTGRYRARAVRELEPELVERYFTFEDNAYVVCRELRALVEFEPHNLVADPGTPPGAGQFDLVLCRNVLIYFDLPVVERVIASLESALAPEGMLVVGAADALCGTAGRLTRRPEPARVAGPALRILRRPLGRDTLVPRDQLLAEALDAANRGRSGDAIERASLLLAENPLDADAYFVRGMVELEAGRTEDAVGSLRRSLYADPTFALAAFKLGRACDALGDAGAARRAYEQALRTLQPDDDRHEVLLQQVDLGDVAAACRARLSALGGRTR
jgi:chemotaxis protein methyltransferase CheR